MYDRAIEHYSNSIAISESFIDRVNRALSYVEFGRCGLAIEDAKTALTLEPEGAPATTRMSRPTLSCISAI